MPNDLNIGLGVQFQPGLQEGLINNRGSTMLHEIAISCTCRKGSVYTGLQGDGEERRRDPYCKRCGGDGWLHRAPLVITGLATSIRQQRNILDAGIAQPGDMLFSPKAEITDCDNPNRKVSVYDKLTALWKHPIDDGQIISRGAGTTADNVALDTGLADDEDRLWYEPFSSIWCEDSNDRTYSEGSDFELGPGKIIRWIGDAPAKGQLYTFKYNGFFEWIVWNAPQERPDRDNVDLGSAVMLRKRHVAFINDNPV
ncbi:MAG: hypothetical protein ACXABY_23385, partial [Candidatus Thorarchaeota archaeon]